MSTTESPYACRYLGPDMDVTKMDDDGSNSSTKIPQAGHVLRKSSEVILESRDLWQPAQESEGKCAL